jgi:hypothetical protein
MLQGVSKENNPIREELIGKKILENFTLKSVLIESYLS